MYEQQRYSFFFLRQILEIKYQHHIFNFYLGKHQFPIFEFRLF